MTTPDATPDATSTEAEVRAAFAVWADAFRARDVDAVMRCYTRDDFTGFDLMPPIQFEGEAMWRQNWVDVLGAFAGAPTLEFADVRVRVSGGLAVLRCFTRLAGTLHGRPLDAWTRQTNCFVRGTDGRWRMFHDHVSFPTDVATGESLMTLAPSLPPASPMAPAPPSDEG